MHTSFYTHSMQHKRIQQKDKVLHRYLKKGGRKEARKDFYELLKRASKTHVKS